MTRTAFFSKAVTNASEREKFFRDERELYEAAKRHVEAARVLAAHPSQLMEAMFHARLAGECFLKHLFCLLRFARGARADTPAEFAVLVLPKDEYQHNAKKIGGSAALGA